MTDYLSKLDFGLLQIYLRHIEVVKASDAERRITVDISYVGNLEEIEALGFETEWKDSDGEADGVLPLSKLEAIASHPNIISINAGTEPKPLLNTSVKDIRARAASLSDLPNKLWHVNTSTGTSAGVITSGTGGATGRGVIIGIIDTGIDVSHPVFNTTQYPFATRILRIWDQGLTADEDAGEKGPNADNLLSTSTYGVEFKSEDINDALNASLLPVVPLEFRHKDCNGHGTHVAATAAGNGQTSRGDESADFVGVAPEADLIVVKYLDVPEEIKDVAGGDVGLDRRFRDAMLYILRVARGDVTEEGEEARAAKPVVINMSFGAIDEPGDGLSKDEIWMDKRLDPDPDKPAGPFHFPQGAIVVKGAGNEGDKDERAHAKITVPNSGKIIVPFKLFDDRGPRRLRFDNCEHKRYVPPLFVYMWYKEVDAPADVAFASRSPMPEKPGIRDGFLKYVWRASREEGLGRGRYLWLDHSTTTTVKRPDGTVRARRNLCYLRIEPSTPTPKSTYLLGSYDVRIKAPPGTVVHVRCERTRRFGFRIADRYRNGDELPARERVAGLADPIELLDVTGTSSLPDGGGENVITVAAYDDKNHHIAKFSSRGPLVDYSDPPSDPLADKPDIAAPGVDINAALSAETAEGIIESIEFAGNRFVEKKGTSMAAPHIAGVVALMLQKTPTMSVGDVMKVFRTRANVRAGANVRDGTNPPSPPGTPKYKNAYGEGLVDAKKSHKAS